MFRSWEDGRFRCLEVGRMGGWGLFVGGDIGGDFAVEVDEDFAR
jgi:hypothetical protein